MSVERTYHCDGPECEGHVRTATPPPYLPMGLIEVRVGEAPEALTWHFCSWDCVLRYAATVPPVEVIHMDPPASIGDGGPE